MTKIKVLTGTCRQFNYLVECPNEDNVLKYSEIDDSTYSDMLILEEAMETYHYALDLIRKGFITEAKKEIIKFKSLNMREV